MCEENVCYLSYRFDLFAFFSFFLLRIFYFVVLLQLENGEWKGLE